MYRLKENKRNSRHRQAKRVIIVALGGLLLLQPAGPSIPGGDSLWGTKIAAASTVAAAPSLVLKQSSIITSGARRLDYVWSTTRSSKTVKTDVHVIEVDLTNPHVSLNAMSGRNNSIGQRNNLLNMSNESGAVGGINGDVFVMSNNEGAPMGPQVTSGVLVTSPANLKGMYAFALTQDRKPVIDSFSFTGSVVAGSGAQFALEGINMSTYTPQVDGVKYSHVNKLYIYTSVWGGAQRPMNSATKPTEALVIDGVVADFSDGEPLAATPPENGYILRGHGEAAKFMREQLQIGQTVTANYSLVSNTNGTTVNAAEYQMLMGGHTLLVHNGAASTFTRDIAGVSGNSYTSRSAVGYSEDGSKVFLITSERSGSNTGVSLRELQQIMIQIGVYKGINLDGGGSTTMTERQLGQTTLQLAHPTQESSQRSVSNGIGVFTLAPPGTLRGMLLEGANVMFLGQSSKYTVRGYDTYYNPFSVDHEALQWSDSAGIGIFQSNSFTAQKTGTSQLQALIGNVKASYDIQVVGKGQIASMGVAAETGMLSEGSTVSVPVTVKLNNGKSYRIPTDSLEWQFVGFKGTYAGGVITVDSVEPDAVYGYAIARYDGFGVMIPFVKGEKTAVVEDFEVSRYAITSQVTPADQTKGSVKLISDLPEQKSKGLQISYDFSAGSGTRAVYAVFGTNGRTLSGSPHSMTLDLYSDNSKNWVRAEIVGADGKVHLVDVAKTLNWSGWKNVKVDLASQGIQFPAKLKRVYVVTVDQNGSDKASTGAIAIDNLVLRTPESVVEPIREKIVMTVEKANATVGSKSIRLETVPLLINGSTYVPVRFVSEAMGATVLYDDKTSRVTVLRGNQMLEMTIGKKEYTLDGVSYTSDVAPFTRDKRTLIPVRLFSEKLGYEVKYESKQRMITIH